MLVVSEMIYFIAALFLLIILLCLIIGGGWILNLLCKELLEVDVLWILKKGIKDDKHK